jgi:hypothetical protein
MESQYSEKPLPIEFSSRFDFSAEETVNITTAYDNARAAETYAFNLTPSDDNELVYARVVGYFLLEGPSDVAVSRMAEEVNSCQTHADILTIGQMYTHSLIRACEHCFILFIFAALIPSTVKRNKGRTPTPISHPSRPSFEKEREDITDLLLYYSNASSQTKAKQFVSIALHAALTVSHHTPSKSLVRDKHRCLATGNWDDDYLNRTAIAIPSNIGSSETQCAHIFSASLDPKKQHDDDKV